MEAVSAKTPKTVQPKCSIPTIPTRGCRAAELLPVCPINLFNDEDAPIAVSAYVDRRENRSKRL